MWRTISRRALSLIFVLFSVTFLTFVVSYLAPGDPVLNMMGGRQDPARYLFLRHMYGLDQPSPVRYLKWMTGIVTRLDFGYSWTFAKPVNDVIGSRIGMTLFIAMLAFVVCWGFAIPVGILVAVKQYTLTDYFFTFMGFIGLAVPSFLLALVLMYISFAWFGMKVGGLFSPEMITAPWSWAKFVDFLAHIWLPVIILAIGGTANLIRTLRATMLDELRKPYVVTARAKGLPEWKVLITYPVRIALNPFVSTIGWTLPYLVSGSIIISVVMSLPTTGPMLLRSLQSQDMYLAGSLILILSILTIIGTLVSDILLAWLDPRIRYQ